MSTDNNMRQKTWGIFVRPYLVHREENFISRGDVYVPPVINTGASYTKAQGGEAWMLYKTSISFVLAREIVKEIMDELGFSRNDIMVTEIVPIDHIVTPIA